MKNQKIIQRAAARLEYLSDLSLNENTIKRTKVDKRDGLVRRMIRTVINSSGVPRNL